MDALLTMWSFMNKLLQKYFLPLQLQMLFSVSSGRNMSDLAEVRQSITLRRLCKCLDASPKHFVLGACLSWSLPTLVSDRAFIVGPELLSQAIPSQESIVS